MLFNEATDLSRGHDVPAAIRADYDILVGLLELDVLDLGLGDQADTFGLEVA